MTVYEEQGYRNRKDYLKNLAEDYGVPFAEVAMFADLLGLNEDFDGLVNMVEDRAEQLDF